MEATRLNKQTDPMIVGLKFQKVGKVYHFDASNFRDIHPGDFAVVETNRGIQLGQVIQIVDNPSKPYSGAWKTVIRSRLQTSAPAGAGGDVRTTNDLAKASPAAAGSSSTNSNALSTAGSPETVTR